MSLGPWIRGQTEAVTTNALQKLTEVRHHLSNDNRPMWCNQWSTKDISGLWSRSALQIVPKHSPPKVSSKSIHKRLDKTDTETGKTTIPRKHCYQVPTIQKHLLCKFTLHSWLHCCGTVGWASGRASGPWKQCWGVGMVICMNQGSDCLHVFQPVLTPSQIPSCLDLCRQKFKIQKVLPLWCRLVWWKRGC